MRIQLLIGCCLGALLCSTAAIAQEKSCDERQLKEAKSRYELGLFEAVFDLLQPCLKNGFAEKEKVEAYRLIALASIATDDLPKAEEAVANLLRIDPLYDPVIYDPLVFQKMVADYKAGRTVVQVTSVSKKAEDILEAPATVMVITEAQIQNRGYIDLIDAITDLPGFDISKIYGVTYANIYQRGFRQNNTERTLFLIDGVEENDLWTNTAFISRQYPLSNIKRIEVVYGPASTMYGPNAFVGVINVITKTGKEVTGSDKNWGITGQVSTGSWNTQSADLTLAGRSKNIELTVTGHYFRSDEMDLSGDPFYDYDPSEFDGIDYKSILDVTSGAADFARSNGLTDSNSFYTLERDANGDTVAVRLTDAGQAEARRLDRSGYDQIVNGEPIAFSNDTEDWLINARLKVSDFTIGFQTWQRKEGANVSFTDMNEAGSRNGSLWVPSLSHFFVKYEKQLSDKLSITGFTRYKSHQVTEESEAVYVFNYTNNNSIADLANGVEPLWVEQFYYQLSNQLRIELKSIYAPTPRIDIVSGFEYRTSNLQGNYLNTFFTGNPEEEGVFFTGDPTNSTSLQAALQGGNQFNLRDIGFYSQGTYRMRDNLKLVLGARVDNNQVRVSDGFGTEVSPRLAVVYLPGKFIFKGIYSRGIQNVSNWTKYSVSDIRIANPNLKTESIRNLEFAAAWRGNKHWFADVVVYQSSISDVVGTTDHPTEVGKEWNDNIGTFLVYGLQSTATYRRGSFSSYFNYTFTNPQDQENDQRIGDIATHQVNWGAHYQYKKHLNGNLRLNFVGERETGEGTTVSFNPDEFPAHMVLNFTVGYRDIFPGLSAQIIVNNLLDEAYNHPGPRSASGTFYTSRVPQRERHFLGKLSFQF